MSKTLPHSYSDLAPTIMEASAVYPYLEELLTLAETGEYDKFEVCEGLCELVQVRLACNYHTISPDYAERVFCWLSSYWPETEEHLDAYVTVLVNLNLDKGVREHLELKLVSNLTAWERNLISDALSEIEA